MLCKGFVLGTFPGFLNLKYVGDNFKRNKSFLCFSPRKPLEGAARGACCDKKKERRSLFPWLHSRLTLLGPLRDEGTGKLIGAPLTLGDTGVCQPYRYIPVDFRIGRKIYRYILVSYVLEYLVVHSSDRELYRSPGGLFFWPASSGPAAHGRLLFGVL